MSFLLLLLVLSPFVLPVVIVALRLWNAFNLRRRDATLRVVFLHPDLGLGGAERLVVDAAVGLLRHQTRHTDVDVTIVTAFHDLSRAFPETLPGATPGLRVVVRGGSVFPRAIRNAGHVLLSTLRMCHAAVVTCAVQPRTDVYVVDQVAAAMPLLKLLAPKARVLFYCHFPDQLCDPSRLPSAKAEQKQRTSLLRAVVVAPLRFVYRGLFDWLEGVAMDYADAIVCNSKFTRGVTIRTFPRLESRIHEVDDIFYPPVNVRTLTMEPPLVPVLEDNDATNPFHNLLEPNLTSLLRTRFTFVSLNRYEGKKNIVLAIRSFAELLARLRGRSLGRAEAIALGGINETRFEAQAKGGSAFAANATVASAAAAASSNATATSFSSFEPAAGATEVLPDARRMLLVVAGGYDPRVAENTSTYHALRAEAERCGVLDQVLFLRSIDARQKWTLLRHCNGVIYTPSGEHFGIVPVEAMAFGKPVVAVSDGGPLESVCFGDRFGYLRAPDPEAFASALEAIVRNPGAATAMGKLAQRRVADVFSIEAFSERFAKRLLALRHEAITASGS